MAALWYDTTYQYYFEVNSSNNTGVYTWNQPNEPPLVTNNISSCGYYLQPTVFSAPNSTTAISNSNAGVNTQCCQPNAVIITPSANPLSAGITYTFSSAQVQGMACQMSPYFNSTGNGTTPMSTVVLTNNGSSSQSNWADVNLPFTFQIVDNNTVNGWFTYTGMGGGSCQFSVPQPAPAPASNAGKLVAGLATILLALLF